MAETKKPVKVIFINSNLATSDHFSTEVQLILDRLGDILRTITGVFQSGKGGVLHPDYFKLRSDGTTLKISPGVAIIPQSGGTYAIAISDSEISIDTDSPLSDGSSLAGDHTYDVYLKYREETTNDIVNINPVSGVMEDGLSVAVVDDSSAQITPLLIPEGYSIYFRDTSSGAPVPSTGFIYLGRIYKGGTDIDIQRQPNLVPIRIPFVDDDPQSRIPDSSITPSVEPYTDLMNFLASKGHAPRTTNNPFGIAYEDVGGPRDYYKFFTKSAIIKHEKSNYDTYKPDRDSSYPIYVKVHLPNDNDFIVLKGVRSDAPPTLEAPPEFPSIFIPEPSNPNPSADYTTWMYIRIPGKHYDNEVWMLAIEYAESENKFYLRWVSGTPDSPVYNEPIVGSDDIDDLSGKVSMNDAYQLLTIDALKQFIESDRFLPILLVGRKTTLTDTKLGVFYESEDMGVQFNAAGTVGDLRKFHFLPMDYVRWGGNYNTSSPESMEQALRKSLGDYLRWHFTILDDSNPFRHYDSDIRSTIQYPGQPSQSVRGLIRFHTEQYPYPADFSHLTGNLNSRGLRYLHHADRILRNSGYLYLKDASKEKDVEGALKALYEEALTPLATVEFRLGENQSESLARWEDVVEKINTELYNRHYIVMLIRPHENNYEFILPVQTNLKIWGTLHIINLGVVLKGDSSTSSTIKNIFEQGQIIIDGGFLIKGYDYINIRDFRDIVVTNINQQSYGISGVKVVSSREDIIGRLFINNVHDQYFNAIAAYPNRVIIYSSEIHSVNDWSDVAYFPAKSTEIYGSVVTNYVVQGLDYTVISDSICGVLQFDIANNPDVLVIRSSRIDHLEKFRGRKVIVEDSVIKAYTDILIGADFASLSNNHIYVYNNTSQMTILEPYYEESGPPIPKFGNAGWTIASSPNSAVLTGNVIQLENSAELRGGTSSSITVTATGNLFKNVSSVDYSRFHPNVNVQTTSGSIQLFDYVNKVEA